MRRKEKEKDVKKRYQMKTRLSKWCNDWREYYLCIYVRYIVDSHHTNKTSQEEYKEQFWNMTDEQIEQHIGMEGGQHLKMLNGNKIKQPNQLTMENYNIIRDEDKYVVVD